MKPYIYKCPHQKTVPLAGGIKQCECGRVIISPDFVMKRRFTIEG